MNRRLKSIAAGLATMLTVVAGSAPAALAATAPAPAANGAGNGIKVSPVRNDVVINPGTSSTVDVYVTNVTNDTTKFQVLVNDFKDSGDESGDPALILNDNQSAPTHSLRQFVAPIGDVTLAPGEQKDVKVPISIPNNATAGGYFGAVRFLTSNSASGSQNVTLSASVASLILVKVPGNLKEQMSIAGFSIEQKNHVRTIFSNGKDLTALARFQNNGNVQEQPFGKVTLKNFRGKVLYSAEINNSVVKGNVLPDSIRRFTLPLKNVGSFGKYTVTGDFGYGSGQVLTANTTFYVLPLPLVITAVVLIILIIIAIIEIPRIIKGYNKRVLRKAGRL